MQSVILYSLTYLSLFSTTEFLYHRGKFPVETTRRLVHIITGAIALTFPLFLKDFWQAATLCISFLGLMALSERNGWFKSITGVDRRSKGSWLFAFIVLICFGIYSMNSDPKFYYLPIMLLTLADPVASYIGKKTRYRPYRILDHEKTVGGSTAFFITCAILLTMFYLDTMTMNMIFLIILYAFILTLVEACSINGWDNFTVPIVSILLLYINEAT